MPNKSPLLKLFLPFSWVTIVAVIAVGWYGSSLMLQLHLDQTAQDLEARARLCALAIAPDLGQDETVAIDRRCKHRARDVGWCARSRKVI